MSIKTILNKWWTSPTWWVQGAHFLLGVTCVTLPYFISKGNETWAIIGTIFLVCYGMIKEVTCDYPIEGEAFFWGGFEDLIFLFLGASFAWGLRFYL